ncbi:hypothetical protein [Burkholderia multivorans]|uniref:hypothetical protein n=1 Tax=Burkholderia multivorans TaxID=87883 RepID=UPI0019D6BE8B|nr:hypothetical protein [Burkholderia multivorans]MBN8169659.1 hypothetical protein [Burkholderia multivorans]
MLRIPNPGSDIDMFVRIFRDLHSILKDREDFDLDDMTLAMLERNNVSSQGAFGHEALRRSTREDRSRDPLYNQSKMYAELFRTLGWMQSTTGALRFAFSWLGEHAALTPDPRRLTEECLLGMAYPNDVLGVQGEHSIRVFPTILRTALALGGGITRDEMIVGPLSISDDRDPDAIASMIDRLRSCRSEFGRLAIEIANLSASRRISHVTMGNYTRFPIAAMQWAGWCVKTSRSMFTLTDAGRETLKRLATLRDVRVSDFKGLPDGAKAPFMRLSAHLMLARAGFDVTSAWERMAEDGAALADLGVPTNPEPLFSPFQQIARREVNAAFPHLEREPNCADVAATPRLVAAAAPGRTREKAMILLAPSAAAVVRDDETSSLERELLADFESEGTHAAAVEAFARRHSNDNQDVFYPLVAALLRIVGFECRTSRRGVNYDRADAMIVDATDSIPIEIKSPGEERELSVKAIRQAVENKIILLSRRQFATTRGTTTLAIGFNPPNERSEVRELIGDVHTAYGFNVGVLDIRSLAALALAAVLSGTKLSLKGFTEMKGVVDVADILP